MGSRPRRRPRVLGIALLCGAALLVSVPALRASALRVVGRALVADDRVEPADIVVVPVWAGVAGAVDAADLIRTGLAPRALVIGIPSTPAEQELARRGLRWPDDTAKLVQLLRALGVDNVDVASTGASSEAEGELLPSWCEQNHVRSLLFVSTPDHSRRIRRLLHRSLAGHGTTAIVRAARFASFDPDRWWTSRDTLRIGIIELEKLLLDVVRHPMS